MKYLVIDTSFNIISIYIINDEKVILSKKMPVEKDMSNKLLPLIRECFNEVNLNIKELDKLFVTIGPGSFTGVRIGVAFAKTVGYFLNIPIYPISTLEYLTSIKTNKNVISIIDARRGNVFAGYYDYSLDILKKEELVSFANLDIKDSDILVSYDNCYNSEKIDIDIMKLINKHLSDKPCNPHLLKPNYLKKTEAEEKLNDKVC